jgi:hypothetical protein
MTNQSANVPSGRSTVTQSATAHPGWRWPETSATGDGHVLQSRARAVAMRRADEQVAVTARR